MAQASIAKRLFWVSLLILPVFLGLTGAALDRAFARATLAGEQQQLRSQIYLLLAAAELDNQQQLRLPNVFTEPRFSEPSSGLYGIVLNPQAEIVWRSPSAQALVLEPAQWRLPTQPGDFVFASITPNKKTNDTSPTLNYQSFTATWGIDPPQQYTLVVLHEDAALMAQRQQYRQQLWRWLGVVGLSLLLLVNAICYWGLKPLRRLNQELNDIRAGHQPRLEHTYPSDIIPITDNFNRVLQREDELRQRYRHSLSDLAHSLKTPLAVIRSQLQKPDSAHLIEQQIQRMDDAVQHQLQRAVRRHDRINADNTDVAVTCDRVIGALDKVYSQPPRQFETNIETGLCFRGDGQDLFEILGNLLDNACKYGGSRIRVNAHRVNTQCMQLNVEDNGQGISRDAADIIVKRGKRLDSQPPSAQHSDAQINGQGIGLAMVSDIVGDYGGQLQVATSELGGARFSLELPAAQVPSHQEL